MREKESHTKLFSYSEFLIGLGLLIGACAFSQNERKLFSAKNDEETWDGFAPHPNLDQYMSLHRFKNLGIGSLL